MVFFETGLLVSSLSLLAFFVQLSSLPQDARDNNNGEKNDTDDQYGDTLRTDVYALWNQVVNVATYLLLLTVGFVRFLVSARNLLLVALTVIAVSVVLNEVDTELAQSLDAANTREIVPINQGVTVPAGNTLRVIWNTVIQTTNAINGVAITSTRMAINQTVTCESFSPLQFFGNLTEAGVIFAQEFAELVVSLGRHRPNIAPIFLRIQAAIGTVKPTVRDCWCRDLGALFEWPLEVITDPNLAFMAGTWINGFLAIPRELIYLVPDFVTVSLDCIAETPPDTVERRQCLMALPPKSGNIFDEFKLRNIHFTDFIESFFRTFANTASELLGGPAEVPFPRFSRAIRIAALFNFNLRGFFRWFTLPGFDTLRFDVLRTIVDVVFHSPLVLTRNAEEDVFGLENTFATLYNYSAAFDDLFTEFEQDVPELGESGCLLGEAVNITIGFIEFFTRFGFSVINEQPYPFEFLRENGTRHVEQLQSDANRLAECAQNLSSAISPETGQFVRELTYLISNLTRLVFEVTTRGGEDPEGLFDYLTSQEYFDQLDELFFTVDQYFIGFGNLFRQFAVLEACPTVDPRLGDPDTPSTDLDPFCCIGGAIEGFGRVLNALVRSGTALLFESMLAIDEEEFSAAAVQRLFLDPNAPLRWRDNLLPRLEEYNRAVACITTSSLNLIQCTEDPGTTVGQVLTEWTVFVTNVTGQFPYFFLPPIARALDVYFNVFALSVTGQCTDADCFCQPLTLLYDITIGTTAELFDRLYRSLACALPAQFADPLLDFAGVMQSFFGYGGTLRAFLCDALSALIDAISFILLFLTDIEGFFTALFEELSTAVVEIINDLLEPIEAAIDALETAIAFLFNQFNALVDAIDFILDFLSIDADPLPSQSAAETLLSKRSKPVGVATASLQNLTGEWATLINEIAADPTSPCYTYVTQALRWADSKIHTEAALSCASALRIRAKIESDLFNAENSTHLLPLHLFFQPIGTGTFYWLAMAWKTYRSDVAPAFAISRQYRDWRREHNDTRNDAETFEKLFFANESVFNGSRAHATWFRLIERFARNSTHNFTFVPKTWLGQGLLHVIELLTEYQLETTTTTGGNRTAIDFFQSKMKRTGTRLYNAAKSSVTNNGTVAKRLAARTQAWLNWIGAKATNAASTLENALIGTFNRTHAAVKNSTGNFVTAWSIAHAQWQLAQERAAKSDVTRPTGSLACVNLTLTELEPPQLCNSSFSEAVIGDCFDCRLFQVYINEFVALLQNFLQTSECEDASPDDPQQFCDQYRLTGTDGRFLVFRNASRPADLTEPRPDAPRIAPVREVAGVIEALSDLLGVDLLQFFSNVVGFLREPSEDAREFFSFWLRKLFVCEVAEETRCDEGRVRGMGVWWGLLWALIGIAVFIALVEAYTTLRPSVTSINGVLTLLLFVGLFGVVWFFLAYGFSPACWVPAFTFFVVIPNPVGVVPIQPQCVANDIFCSAVIPLNQDCFGWFGLDRITNTSECPDAEQNFERDFFQCSQDPYRMEGVRVLAFALEKWLPGALESIRESQFPVTSLLQPVLAPGTFDFPPGATDDPQFVQCAQWRAHNAPTAVVILLVLLATLAAIFILGFFALWTVYLAAWILAKIVVEQAQPMSSNQLSAPPTEGERRTLWPSAPLDRTVLHSNTSYPRAAVAWPIA